MAIWVASNVSYSCIYSRKLITVYKYFVLMLSFCSVFSFFLQLESYTYILRALRRFYRSESTHFLWNVPARFLLLTWRQLRFTWALSKKTQKEIQKTKKWYIYSCQFYFGTISLHVSVQSMSEKYPISDNYCKYNFLYV